MENLLIDSLVIGGLGLLLLFFALLVLYALMYLLTAVLREVTPTPEHPILEGQDTPGGKEALHRAAAIAVALARTEQEPSPWRAHVAREITDAEAVSTWWALHHGRRLAQEAITRRRRETIPDNTG